MATSSTPPATCKMDHGSKIVIAYILMYSTNMYTLVRVFACVARVFVRYCLSFKLSKCKFSSPRVEYFDYDLTAQWNYPAQSKINLLTYWTLPTHGTLLAAFIGLSAFYSCFSPWFDINLKSLRVLNRSHHRKDIPRVEWTTDIVNLFDKCKKSIIFTPVFTRYDSAKYFFLKIDWSAEGIGYILLQPDNSIESMAVTMKLLETRECNFELTIHEPRLRPVCFNFSRMKKITIPLSTKQHVDIGSSHV